MTYTEQGAARALVKVRMHGSKGLGNALRQLGSRDTSNQMHTILLYRQGNPVFSRLVEKSGYTPQDLIRLSQK